MKYNGRNMQGSGKVLVAAVLWAIHLVVAAQTTSISELVNYNDSTVLVAAHRGDWRNYPENSLSAIRSCIEKGIDIVEVDVRMTKDSNYVLMHDATINRTTNGRGRVCDYTLATLKTFKLKGPGGKLTGDSIPSLGEALALAKGKIVLNLDKSVISMEGLLKVIDSMDAEQTVILKGSLAADYFKKKAEEYPGGPLFMPILHYMKYDDAEKFLNHSSAVISEMILGTDTSYLCKERGIALFHDKNCRLWYNAMYRTLACGYGENKNALYTWDFLISKGAYVIQTDFPFHLMQHLINRGLHERPEGWVDIDLSKLPAEAPDTGTVKTTVQNTTPNGNTMSASGAVYYTIRAGDTLWALSKRYKTTVAAICKLNNNLAPDTVLKIGRKIRVK